MRSSGEPTYFASDVAYHEDKLERGYDRMINVLGSDHHGYIARMKAAMAALGVDPDRLEILILQFVHIVEGGRARVDVQAPRRVRDARRPDRGDRRRRHALLHAQPLARLDVDLDVDLAKRRSSENPVYYVQYATPASRRSCARSTTAGEAARADRAASSCTPSERELIKKLLAFPGEVPRRPSGARRTASPAYALELAQAFAAFYRDCPVRGAGSDALRSLRLGQVRATKAVIARSLGLLGVEAPDVDVITRS